MRDQVRAAAAVIGLSLVLGLIGAPIWVAIAPLPEIHVVNGEYRLSVVTEVNAAADLSLGLVCMGAAVIVCAFCLIFLRRAPLGAVLGAVLGGALGSAIVWRLGARFAGGETTAELAKAQVTQSDGSVFNSALELHSYGVLVLWPLVASAVLAIAFAFRTSRLHGQAADEAQLREPATYGISEQSAPS